MGVRLGIAARLWLWLWLRLWLWLWLWLWGTMGYNGVLPPWGELFGKASKALLAALLAHESHQNCTVMLCVALWCVALRKISSVAWVL